MNSLRSREPLKRPKDPASPKLARSTPALELRHLEDGQRFGQSLGNLSCVRMQAADLVAVAVALAGELGIGVIP